MKLRKRLRYLIWIFALVPVSAAFANWEEDGTPVCTAGQRQYFPQMISDGAGGALIAWGDFRDGGSDIYVQRMSSTGVPQWTADGVALYAGFESQQDVAIVSDGAGGAICVWVDYRDTATNNADVYCRRIDANGVPMWSATAVPVCVLPESQSFIDAAEDGAGGAIIVWSDERNGTDPDVYAQRVNGSGVVQWATNGIPIATLTDNQWIPSIISDGAGGAIIAWGDRRIGNSDIYAQRVNASGVIQWTVNGVAVCTATGTQRNVELVTDLFGGAIATWWDARGGNFDIYSQRMSPTGVMQWTADGVAVCTAAGDQSSAVVAPSGNGGVLITWLDLRNGTDYDVYARFVNSSGVPKWTADGVKLCNAPEHQNAYAIVNDGAGGAVVVWGDGRDNGGVEWNHDVYAGRVSNTGALLWATDGVLLCAAEEEQQNIVMIGDGSGGAMAVWVDDRIDSYDIYAQRVLPNGEVPIVPTAVANRIPSLRASDVYPNPFATQAWIDLELSSPASVHVDVFDVAGRAVRRMSVAANRAQRIAFDGRDQAGRLLPSGVYFYRVTASGETITRKMVIAR